MATLPSGIVQYDTRTHIKQGGGKYTDNQCVA
jgi:hypothetical protein